MYIPKYLHFKNPGPELLLLDPVSAILGVKDALDHSIWQSKKKFTDERA